MHTSRKPKDSVSPAKIANKGVSEAPAEWMKERKPAERDAAQPAPPRSQSRNETGIGGLNRVREPARKEGDLS
jgi:hypothetical protein